MIELKHVTKVFPPETVVLREANLHIPRGDYVLIGGTVGSGTSVLFQLLLRYELATRGEVNVFGRDLAKLTHKEIPLLRRRIGWISQEPQFMQTRSVYENLSDILYASGTVGREADQRTREVLSQFGLEFAADSLPGELSRGQAQKLAIARSLLLHPAILLADDPFAYLTVDEVHSMVEMFKDLNVRRGLTILVATYTLPSETLGVKRVVEIQNGAIIEHPVADV